MKIKLKREEKRRGETRREEMRKITEEKKK